MALPVRERQERIVQAVWIRLARELLEQVLPELEHLALGLLVGSEWVPIELVGASTRDRRLRLFLAGFVRPELLV